MRHKLIPEVIVAKEAVVLSLLDGDVYSSCSGHELQEISYTDCLVGVRRINLADGE